MPSILIVDTIYPAFLARIKMNAACRRNQASTETYEEQLQCLHRFRFGTSDVYSTQLKRMGWEAEELIANSDFLQSIWCRQRGRSYLPLPAQLSPAALARVPIAKAIAQALPTIRRSLVLQVEAQSPDVVYFQDLSIADPQLLKRLRRSTKVIAGQIASPLPPKRFLRGFDVIFTSLPNLQTTIQNAGVDSELLPIAFDRRVLEEVEVETRPIPLSFVGGISRNHSTTIPMLSVAQKTNNQLQIYGYGAEHLEAYPILKSCHLGEAWGLDMYRILGSSVATLNRHIDVADSFANNMRLYEATGMGSLLITDWKTNLREIFELDLEILTYRNLDELADRIRWVQNNPEHASQIAQRGQARTLREHTYDKRIRSLSDMLLKRLNRA